MAQRKIKQLLSDFVPYCLFELALPMTPWLIEYVLKALLPALGPAQLFTKGLAVSAILSPSISLVRTDMAIRDRGLRRSASLTWCRWLQVVSIVFAISLFLLLLVFSSPIWPPLNQQADSQRCYRFLISGLFVTITSGFANQFFLAVASIGKEEGTDQRGPSQDNTQRRSNAKTGEDYPSCFISHSHKDEEFAKKLYGDLRNRGVTCWYAPEDTSGILQAGIREFYTKRPSSDFFAI